MKRPVKAEGIENTIKNLLADPSSRIELDDYVTELLRKAIDVLKADSFRDSLPELSAGGIQLRLTQYEEVIGDLLKAVILMSRWGLSDQISLIEKIVLRLSETSKTSEGLVIWQSMRWYPICLIIYAGGIAALSAHNYPMLAVLLQTQVPSATHSSRCDALVVRILNEMMQLGDAFKILPAHTRHHVPRSEYLFNALHEPLDRPLFLGESYDRLFDEFEIILALTYADITSTEHGRIWAPPGRFGYRSSIQDFITKAEAQGENMPLLQVGLFSSAKRFKEVAKSYLEQISQINWR